KSCRMWSPACRITPSCAACLKPRASAVNLYSPRGSCGNRYCPAPFEVAVRVCCVATCNAVTVTRATNAPLGSVICPVISAVFICPRIALGRHEIRQTRSKPLPWWRAWGAAQLPCRFGLDFVLIAFIIRYILRQYDLLLDQVLVLSQETYRI